MTGNDGAKIHCEKMAAVFLDEQTNPIGLLACKISQEINYYAFKILNCLELHEVEICCQAVI